MTTATVVNDEHAELINRIVDDLIEKNIMFSAINVLMLSKYEILQINATEKTLEIALKYINQLITSRFQANNSKHYRGQMFFPFLGDNQYGLRLWYLPAFHFITEETLEGCLSEFDYLSVIYDLKLKVPEEIRSKVLMKFYSGTIFSVVDIFREADAIVFTRMVRYVNTVMNEFIGSAADIWNYKPHPIVLRCLEPKFGLQSNATILINVYIPITQSIINNKEHTLEKYIEKITTIYAKTIAINCLGPAKLSSGTPVAGDDMSREEILTAQALPENLDTEEENSFVFFQDICPDRDGRIRIPACYTHAGSTYRLKRDDHGNLLLERATVELPSL